MRAALASPHLPPLASTCNPVLMLGKWGLQGVGVGVAAAAKAWWRWGCCWGCLHMVHRRAHTEGVHISCGSPSPACTDVMASSKCQPPRPMQHSAWEAGALLRALPWALCCALAHNTHMRRTSSAS